MKATEFLIMMEQDIETVKASKPHLVGVLEGLKVLVALEPCAEIDHAKTLDLCFDSIKEHAKKKQKGGGYCVPPDEALKLIGEYFGLAKNAVAIKQAPQAVRKEIDLDDLL